MRTGTRERRKGILAVNTKLETDDPALPAPVIAYTADGSRRR